MRSRAGSRSCRTRRSCCGRATATRCSSSCRRWMPRARTVIKHVMSGVNPQGVQVVSFKQPSAEELDHNFLWRVSKALPSAAGSASSTARTTRRSSRCGSTRSGSSRSGCRRGPRRGVLAGALRGHQRLRAPPRPQRDQGRQVLPARLQGRAEGALSRAARHPGKEWKFNAADVAERARFDEYIVRVRGRADRDLDAVGALVRDPRRSLVDHAVAGRLGDGGDHCARWTWAGPRSRRPSMPPTPRRARLLDANAGGLTRPSGIGRGERTSSAQLRLDGAMDVAVDVIGAESIDEAVRPQHGEHAAA